MTGVTGVAGVAGERAVTGTAGRKIRHQAATAKLVLSHSFKTSAGKRTIDEGDGVNASNMGQVVHVTSYPVLPPKQPVGLIDR